MRTEFRNMEIPARTCTEDIAVRTSEASDFGKRRGAAERLQRTEVKPRGSLA